MQLTLPLPIPHECIWCKRKGPEVSFDTESHALPASAGNAEEVLPRGVVCDQCNFGWGKIERVLGEYPLFKIGAWAVHSENVRTGNPFCRELRDDSGNVVPLPRDSAGGIRLVIRMSGQKLQAEVTTAAQSTITVRYTPRRLALLSRAVHKVAFEGFAWGMYVEGVQQGMIANPLSSLFDHIRSWTKRGHPQGSVRPFLEPADLSAEVDIRDVKFGPSVYADKSASTIVVKYRDGFSWFAVSLLSAPQHAAEDLGTWATRVGLERAILISDNFSVLRSEGPPEAGLRSTARPG